MKRSDSLWPPALLQIDNQLSKVEFVGLKSREGKKHKENQGRSKAQTDASQKPSKDKGAAKKGQESPKVRSIRT